MPFASDAQRKYLYSQKPEVAEKFAKHSGMRDDIETATAIAEKRGKRKKKMRTAGLFSDMVDKFTGKKRQKKIEDILNQDPTSPQPPKKSDEDETTT
jgi:HD superfamily phosphohydrolase YqeK